MAPCSRRMQLPSRYIPYRYKRGLPPAGISISHVPSQMMPLLVESIMSRPSLPPRVKPTDSPQLVRYSILKVIFILFCVIVIVFSVVLAAKMQLMIYFFGKVNKKLSNFSLFLRNIEKKYNFVRTKLKIIHHEQQKSSFPNYVHFLIYPFWPSSNAKA